MNFQILDDLRKWGEEAKKNFDRLVEDNETLHEDNEQLQLDNETQREENEQLVEKNSQLVEKIKELAEESGWVRTQRDDAMGAGRTVVECADQMRDEANAEIERLTKEVARLRTALEEALQAFDLITRFCASAIEME